MIGAGAVVDHDSFGRGTVLEVNGGNARIYFAAQEETPAGPCRNVQLARVSLVEESADQPDTGYPSYSVYVVELRETSPSGSPTGTSKPDLYVGISRNSPSVRFTALKTGGRTAGTVVKKKGLFLRPGLYRHYERVVDAEAAKDLEQRVAADLREQGHVVYAGASGFPFEGLKQS